MRFVRTGDYEFKTEKITKKELEDLREQARKDKQEWMVLGRSCWECNSAHVHHLEGGGKYNCFACGRYYYNNVDITDYTDSELEKYAITNLITP